MFSDLREEVLQKSMFGTKKKVYREFYSNYLKMFLLSKFLSLNPLEDETFCWVLNLHVLKLLRFRGHRIQTLHTVIPTHIMLQHHRGIYMYSLCVYVLQVLCACCVYVFLGVDLTHNVKGNFLLLFVHNAGSFPFLQS